MTAPLDLMNQRFGKLVVIARANNDRFGKTRWLCVCDCGKQTTVSSGDLKEGKTQSCGCFKVDGLKRAFGDAAINLRMASYKSKAKAANRVFDLTFEQFKDLVLQNCYYCGDTPSNISVPQRSNGAAIINGIDRVDNTKGYVLDNVVPCCIKCNRGKMHLDIKTFIRWVLRAADYIRATGLDKLLEDEERKAA